MVSFMILTASVRNILGTPSHICITQGTTAGAGKETFTFLHNAELLD
jgi:hypothetical protein